MRKVLQILITLILISVASCQSKTEIVSNVEVLTKSEQKDSLDNEPSKMCIYRGHRYHRIYEENDFPGEQIENFNPDTIKKYGFKYLEITSSVYGLTRKHYFDTNGRVIQTVHTGNSPLHPSSTVVMSYTTSKKPIPMDSASIHKDYPKSQYYPLKKIGKLESTDTISEINKKALSYQWPIWTKLEPIKNGWILKSYIDSSLVYKGIVTVSENCDTMILKDHRMANLNIPLGQDLPHYFTEYFIFENDILKHYKFITTKQTIALAEYKWPKKLENEFIYFPNGLRERVIHKEINKSGELIETIYYKYYKAITY
ncbi:hypothetical protein ERX46_16975 [Brumimicrobium glaciale]|uniref:Uncharacterized protein n=1 Tax=Brumimicrobium glaciale TaxID=200475 RepID=A0A4Q4KCT1_9FLAO|nr:hypothetical protein [Brumimicrobium glaciale]RYM30773.1 hypothetical protein ERX46_16975 [Brumimicrobium glaciale]